MPWIEGHYEADYADKVDPRYPAFYVEEKSHRVVRHLRIPPPAVLLAMEEVIEAVKEDIALNPEIGASPRVLLGLSALARAEAEAKEPR